MCDMIINTVTRVKWQHLIWHIKADGISVRKLSNGNTFLLNSIAAQIWKFILDAYPVEKMVTILQEKYEMPKEIIVNDINRVLDNFYKNDLIEIDRRNICSVESSEKKVSALLTSRSRDESIISKHIPVNSGMDLTYKCNYQCKHCIAKDSRTGKNYLSLKEISGVVSQLADLGTANITFSGGEPFIRPDIIDIVEITRKQGLYVSIITNGSYINSDIASTLKEYGVGRIDISLHSVCPEVHDTFVGIPGAHSKAINAIDILKENEINVVIRSSLTKFNHSEFIPLCKFCQENQMDFEPNMMMYPTYEGHHEPCKLAMNKEHLKLCLAYWRQTEEDGKSRINIRKGTSKICSAGRSRIHITPTGNVQPCNTLPIILGNVRDSSIHDIWHKSPILYEIRNFEEETFEKCKKCDIASTCAAFCIGLNYSQTGSMKSVSESVCSYARVLNEIVVQSR